VMADLAEEAVTECRVGGGDHVRNHPWPGQPTKCLRCGKVLADEPPAEGGPK
jgi:hypothetical protein